MFPELQSLMIKTAGLGDLLRDQLLKQSDLIELAFIFGSYAKRLEDAESDIDLFIIGDITGRRVSQILAPARESLRREINTVIMKTQEAQSKYRDENQILATVIDEQKIFLIGGEDDLSSLLSGRTQLDLANFQSAKSTSSSRENSKPVTHKGPSKFGSN